MLAGDPEEIVPMLGINLNATPHVRDALYSFVPSNLMFNLCFIIYRPLTMPYTIEIHSNWCFTRGILKTIFFKYIYYICITKI